MFKVGIDVGGTFTDIFGLDSNSGKVYTGKHLTTPEDLPRGVIGAIKQAGINLSEIDQLIHGSTIAINTLLQRNYYGWWPKVALVTTEGFRDTMEIGRYNREHMYDVYQKDIEPLIKRRSRFTVAEKIDAKGKIIKKLDVDSLRALAKRFKELEIESVAVVFINSYINPEHEKLAKEVLEQELPGIPITTSFETCPKIRELGRIVTTSVRAILIPIIANYTDNLVGRLKEANFKGVFLVVKSDGGVATAEAIKRCPETMLVSGPSAGVYSGLNLGAIMGIKNIITQDMGGTSYDVCIIEDGQYLQTTEFQLDVDMPIITPLIDVRSIGTGGGSLAWIDSGGSFRVGPQSAGSNPGPACYGFGGTNPTVTDANLVLGRIDETLGGKLQLNKEAALTAIKSKIAEPLGIDPIEAAEGIIRISCANMARAISLVTTDRGRDPRNFVPAVFGGAGPMQMCDVADLLDIPKMIVPATSGVSSAAGAIMMPLKMSADKTFFTDVVSVDIDQLNAILDDMGNKVTDELVAQGAERSNVCLRRLAEMRYIGQTYEVLVEFPEGKLDEIKIGELTEKFHIAHEKEYFVCNRGFSQSIVNLIVEGTAIVGNVQMPKYPNATQNVNKALKDIRQVYFNGEFMETPVYDYEKLMPTHTFVGPAIIDMNNACAVIASSWKVVVDMYRNIVLEKIS